MKVGCIIQGDIRRGTKLVLSELPKLFDYTVFSTWDDGKSIPPGNFEVIRSAYPPEPGFNHRNFQRLSTAKGLQAAKSAGCNYILKWRSDMLPTSISIEQLLVWTNFQPPPNAKSRIVLPAFRNLSIVPDCFSSIPDLFSFGHIEEMEKLWGDKDFNYSQEFNLPQHEHETLDQEILNSNNFMSLYCPEAELYTLYRNQINLASKSNFSHKYIAENYFRLIDYRNLGVLWFGAESGFRPIGAAWEHPWWTERQWQKKIAKVQPFGYTSSGFIGKMRRKISRFKINQELKKQQKIWDLIYSKKLYSDPY